MNWKNYLILSEKTLSSEFHCDSRDERLLHAVMGILTEIEELLDNHSTAPNSEDEVNRREEIVDALWYCAIIAREFNVDFSQSTSVSPSDSMSTIIDIIKNSCKLLDILKKKIYYNKPVVDDNFKTIFEKVLSSISDYANYYSINLEENFDKNIAKLKARYGDKFSSERAINRDTDSERKILES